ncbi:hypothetical protein HY419_01245, partial [candidate division WWE3 bacterium]|nr:hypothetical protein [candidate division WWE3 bacterium]
KEVIKAIASQVTGQPVEDIDQFEFDLEDGKLTGKFALLIKIEGKVEDRTTSVANDIRSWMQSYGMRYYAAAESLDDIPAELKVSAYPIF